MKDNQPTTPHNDLRILEATLRKQCFHLPSTDPVWGALDRLWNHVVLGPDAKDGTE